MSDRKALLVVDVQVGMFDPRDPVHEGEALLERIGALIGRARAAGVPVVYVQHDEPGSPLEPFTPGWAIHPAIAPVEGEVVIRKRTPDSFHGTALQEELARLGVNHLVLTGNQTECCIDTTCRRAASLGYRVTLVADGHSTWDSRELQAAQIIAHHNRVLGECFAALSPADACAFGDG